MAKIKEKFVEKKEFEKFGDETVKTLTSIVKALGKHVGITKEITDKKDGILIKMIRSQKGLFGLMTFFFFLSFWRDEVETIIVFIFSNTWEYIFNLFKEISPDTKWQTIIVIPLTVVATLLGKWVYDKLKKRKKN